MPPFGTASGKKNIPQVVITSTRSDKYDRYLADVFIPRKDVILSEAKDLSSFIYLNNRLLEEHLAERV